jgi:hypothetical protein
MDIPGVQVLAEQGLAWLTNAVAENRHLSGAPIGLYFARLWYHELMYPLVFAVSALTRAIRYYSDRHETPPNHPPTPSCVGFPSERSHLDGPT